MEGQSDSEGKVISEEEWGHELPTVSGKMNKINANQ